MTINNYPEPDKGRGWWGWFTSPELAIATLAVGGFAAYVNRAIIIRVAIVLVAI